MEEKKPIQKRYELKEAIPCQYQKMPTIKVIKQVKPIVVNATVYESKPTLGSVRCFIKRELTMKKKAAVKEIQTGIHVATTPSMFAESSLLAEKMSEKPITILEAIIVSDPNM